MDAGGLAGGRPAVVAGADGDRREGEVEEREGVEHRLETGREREGVGHPESMLDPGWCRKMVLRPLSTLSGP